MHMHMYNMYTHMNMCSPSPTRSKSTTLVQHGALGALGVQIHCSCKVLGTAPSQRAGKRDTKTGPRASNPTESPSPRNSLCWICISCQILRVHHGTVTSTVRLYKSDVILVSKMSCRQGAVRQAAEADGLRRIQNAGFIACSNRTKNAFLGSLGSLGEILADTRTQVSTLPMMPTMLMMTTTSGTSPLAARPITGAASGGPTDGEGSGAATKS